MPTYDYRCERCDTLFEYWQSMADDALTTCPATGGPAACIAPGEGPVKKVFSSVGISFKGDGFYKNDHGSNAASRRSDSSSSADTASSSSSASSGGESSSSDTSSGGTSSGDTSTSSSSSSSGSGSGSSSAD